MEMATLVYSLLSRLHSQRLVQRNWSQVVDRHLRSYGCDFAKLVQFSHRIVEDGRDDSSVTVSGRTGVSLAQPKIASETIEFGVMHKFQMHPVGVVFSAGKAVIFLRTQTLRQAPFHRHIQRDFNAAA